MERIDEPLSAVAKRQFVITVIAAIAAVAGITATIVGLVN